MTIMQDHAPNVTRLPGWTLSELVLNASARPCAAPDADPEAWFPIEPAPDPRHDPHGEKFATKNFDLEQRALSLCRPCPVELACLERAIRLEGPRMGHGIAGGTTARQRQDIKISRGLVTARYLAGAA